MCALKDKDLYLSNIDSQIGFNIIVNRYLKEILICLKIFLILRSTLKDIDNKINMIVENNKTKAKIEIKDNIELLVF